MPRGRKPKYITVTTKFERNSKVIYQINNDENSIIVDDGKNIELCNRDGTKLVMSYIGPAFKKMVAASQLS